MNQVAKSVRRLPSVSVNISCIDCEQSLFFLENQWKRTQNKYACERDCERDLGAAMAENDECGKDDAMLFFFFFLI